MTEERIAWLKEQLESADYVHLGNWGGGEREWDVRDDLRQLIEERTVAAEARKEGIEAVLEVVNQVAKPFEEDIAQSHYPREIDDRCRRGVVSAVATIRAKADRLKKQG